jgi:hypothetical protein
MTDKNLLISQRIRVRITKEYHQEPVISRLVSDYGLTINIRAAFLGQDATDGWFDLDLQGDESQIANGLMYLQELKLEVWDNDRIGDW